MEELNTLQKNEQEYDIRMESRQYCEQEYNNIINTEKYKDALFEECMTINYNIRKIQLLTNLAGNINILNNNGKSLLGKSLLWIAVYNRNINNLNIVKCLVENGADVNLQNKDGDTALHYASSMNNLEVVKYLAEHGANVNLQNHDGSTALHCASTMHYLDIIKYLVEQGADVNLQNICGDSVLHWTALSFKHLDMTKYLVEHGADINLQNKQHKTVFQDSINEIKQYLDSLNN